MPGPILDLPTLHVELARARQRGARIVLTNGVFDLLHVGHLRYLRQARREGDVLVVGVNADTAVHKPGRPLVADVERAELVAALEPVDYVVIFAEATADGLLSALRPDVYVKGADYAEATLPEADTARRVGARLVFASLVAGRSSSALVQAAMPELVDRHGRIADSRTAAAMPGLTADDSSSAARASGRLAEPGAPRQDGGS